MIYIIIVLIMLAILGIFINKKSEDFMSNWDFFGSMTTFISIVLLVMSVLIWVVSYNSYKAEINKYNITKQTISESRKTSISDIERAALTTKIIEINADIADARYYNNTIFGDIIPDEYANLDFLK